jgi:hypothetical protein
MLLDSAGRVQFIEVVCLEDRGVTSMLKFLAAAASGAAVATFFVVMHADVPYFAPRPEEMFSAASGPFLLGAAAEITVTTVPSDKWLVLTDACLGEPSIGDVDILERDSTGADTLKVPAALWAQASASFVNPMPQSIGHSGGHGVTFRPGTSVVLKNTGFGTNSYGFMLVGYFLEK